MLSPSPCTGKRAGNSYDECIELTVQHQYLLNAGLRQEVKCDSSTPPYNGIEAQRRQEKKKITSRKTVNNDHQLS